MPITTDANTEADAQHLLSLLDLLEERGQRPLALTVGRVSVTLSPQPVVRQSPPVTHPNAEPGTTVGTLLGTPVSSKSYLGQRLQALQNERIKRQTEGP